MGKRKQIKRYRAWAEDTRQRAAEHARALTLDLVSGQPNGIALYEMGVALAPDEIIYQTCPAQFSWAADATTTVTTYPGHYGGCGKSWTESRRQWSSDPMTTWAITSERLVCRAASGELYSLYWSALDGVQVDLASERVAMDLNGRGVMFAGPAVAPIAVGAIAKLYGPQALLDHPALAPLRVTPNMVVGQYEPVEAIENAATEQGIEDVIRSL